MRIVRWSPQQRVDIPDITALSFLVLGEFRRHVRGMLLGPGTAPATERHSSRIIKGFLIEPQAVPDSTVRVRLDPGADVLGFAVGSENLGRLDQGQLFGGDDQAGNLEGNASATLDFAALPALAYDVEIRFVYADGTNDNRAFWDAGTNTEFIAATDTRHLPTYELRAVAASVFGDEWQRLATVTWDGVGPITTVQIADAREQLFEGNAFLFQSPTQTGLDGTGDFDRNIDRLDPATQVNELYRIAFALQRQIRDTKGPSYIPAPVFGQRWDWFSRPLRPVDYATAAAGAGTLPLQQTKSLASIDVATYTIGDGVSTFGDFNGVTALEDCFAALDGALGHHGGSRPNRVKIVMKTTKRATSIAYVVTTPRDFTASGDLSIEIEAVSVDGEGGSAPRAVIEFTGGASENDWLFVRGLVLKNLDMSTTDERRTMLRCGELEAFNCELTATLDTTTFDDLTNGNYLIDCSREAFGDEPFLLDNCRIDGFVRLFDTTVNAIPFNRRRAARIVSCRMLGGGLILNDIDAGAGTQRCAAGLRVEGCVISGPPASFQTGYVGIVDGRSAENVTYLDCQLTQGSREYDIVRLGDGVGSAPSQNWLFDNTLFRLSSAARATAVDGGANGTRGTGWAIFALATGTNVAEDEDKIIVRNGMVQGPGAATNTDAGAFYFEDIAEARVTGCHFHEFGSANGTRAHIVRFQSSAGTQLGKASVLAHCRFDKFISGGLTGEVVAVEVRGVAALRIHDNVFSGLTEGRTVVTLDPVPSCAISVRGARALNVHDNYFEGWGNANAGIHLERVAGGATRLFSIQNNQFVDVAVASGGYAIQCGTVSIVEEGKICDNLVFIQGVTGQGIDATDTTNMVVNDNNIQMPFSAGPDGITWGAGSVTCVCSGNRVRVGTISGGGAGVIHGLQNSARNDLNLFP